MSQSNSIEYEIICKKATKKKGGGVAELPVRVFNGIFHKSPSLLDPVWTANSAPHSSTSANKHKPGQLGV